MTKRVRHYDDQTLQAYLESDLEREMDAAVRDHVAVCSACESRLEGWKALHEELDTLTSLEPSPVFRERVLAQVTTLPKLATEPKPGFLGRFAGAFGRTPGQNGAHVTTKALQEVLDGTAGRRVRRRLESHVAGCGTCRTELEGWERLFGNLDHLGHLEPSPGFAGAVLRRLEYAPATDAARHEARRRSPLDRAVDAVRSLAPSTPLGWSAAAAMAVAPALGLLLVVTAVLLSPLIQPTDLVSFLSFMASDLVQSVTAVAMQWIGSGMLTVMDLGAFRALVSSPVLALSSVLLIWTTMASAGWILYRHLVAPNNSMSAHVHASS